MSHYFDHASQELYSKIAQAKVYITRHNPTTGALAEAVLRQFLKDHLPEAVSVEQGFIIDSAGGLSKQCDILIYDSHRYAPFYRVGGGGCGTGGGGDCHYRSKNLDQPGRVS
ncbi:DUF6602 domain-containing protein [Pseudomonas aeruginosa]